MPQVTYGAHTYGEIRHIHGLEKDRLIVGKYCSIAERVSAFWGRDHNINCISTFPFYHFRRGIRCQPPLPETKGDTVPDKREPVHINIGNDVWIGEGTTIFQGATIGDGACIGAFSLITKDISPYSVVVGHSRILRKRFTQKDIDFLLKLKWWDFDDKTVGELAPILHTSDIGLLRKWADDKGM